MTRRQPFSIYPNTGLEKLIRRNLSFEALKASHLVVAATDYTRGALKAFYTSPLVDAFVAEDLKLPLHRRRLAHWRKIDGQELLVTALLAAVAIPVFFQPVRLTCRVRTDRGNIDERGWHIDGGVGNHTPTREAAYFLRYLEQLHLGIAGEVYCVKQDPPRILEEGQQRFSATDVLKRSLEVYHHLHMEPIIRAWFRINVEVDEHSEKVARLVDWLDQQAIPVPLRNTIGNRIERDLGTLGGAVGRLDVPMTEIEPASALGDSLDFDPARIRENIKRGYGEMLTVLRSKARLDANEYAELINQPVFPEARS